MVALFKGRPAGWQGPLRQAGAVQVQVRLLILSISFCTSRSTISWR
jgi:hypothetical protein